MKKIISSIAAAAVLGFVVNAMATTTTAPTTPSNATKPVAAAPATTASTTPAKPASTPATAPAVKPVTTATTTAPTMTGSAVNGQITFLDPTTIKVKDLKNGQEWSLNVGTANVKTYKVGDKVMATYDGATKTLKSIEMAK